MKTKRVSLRDFNLEPSCTIALTIGARRIVGELEARMLKAIEETGSYSQAARSLDLSYAFVWNTIAEISSSVNRKIVMSERGGAKGGRATLTADGRRLLEAYVDLDSKVRRFLSGEVGPKPQVSKGGLTPPDLSFVGSHCLVVERILASLHARKPGITYQMINVGSWGGLTAMMLREADIAGIHIFDETESRYNKPLLSKYWLSRSCSLIRGYKRQQSLMVRRGNPKKIKGIVDLLRRDVKLANRNLGSGTRILLDRELQALARARRMDLNTLTSRIRGYDSEMMTHRDVAKTVASKRADVGIGLTSAASEMKLDYIPMAEELYDFLAEKRLRNPYVRAFFDLVGSRAFQREVEASTPGIGFLQESGRVIS